LFWINLKVNKKIKTQHTTAAKNHWGRCLDKQYFSILATTLTGDKSAASNSPAFFSSGR